MNISITNRVTDAMFRTWCRRCEWDTGLSADTVEWCPVEPYTNMMVCGTYQLDKNDTDNQTATKQKRLGRIYLFEINDDPQPLCPIDTVETSGILDQKWCYHEIDGHPILAVATSDGFLKLYQLIENTLKLWLEECLGENLLALSVDWSTNKLTSRDAKIVVSDSQGKVTVFKVRGCLEKEGEWKAHGFEAWISAFNYWSPNVFYSGGDDCIFKSYDTRIPDAAVVVNKSHESGVTSIRSHVDVEHQILTGSYDENVRLWDSRQLKRPTLETNVNGGVWRLKYHPYKPEYILAACMYGGFRVLSWNASEMSIVSEYMKHESIAYGADWKFSKKSSFIGTCSFYDCKLHISEIDL